MINPLFLEVNGERIKIVTKFHCGFCGTYGLVSIPENENVLFPMYEACMECTGTIVVMEQDVLWQ